MKTNIIYNDKKHLKKLLKELTRLEKERLLNGKCVIIKSKKNLDNLNDKYNKKEV